MPAQQISWEAVDAKPISFIHPAVVSNGFVFTAGQVGVDLSTWKVADSIEEQTEKAIENLKKVLEAAGSSLEKVIKATVFVSHALYAPVVNGIYVKYFGHAPARSCVVVGFPDPALKFEIEAVATTD